MECVTCSVRDEKQGDQKAQEAGPAHHPELSPIADVVEEDCGSQGTQLTHSC